MIKPVWALQTKSREDNLPIASPDVRQYTVYSGDHNVAECGWWDRDIPFPTARMKIKPLFYETRTTSMGRLLSLTHACVKNYTPQPKQPWQSATHSLHTITCCDLLDEKACTALPNVCKLSTPQSSNLIEVWTTYARIWHSLARVWTHTR